MKLLRTIFFLLFVRLVVFFLLGVNIRHRERLPSKGPAIIVGNHNSHLDTLVLMSLLPAKLLPKIRAVAAADYFLQNKVVAWFSLHIMGILPISRTVNRHTQDPLIPCYEALDDEGILILFPEGSRGDPEQFSEFKNGIIRLAKNQPSVPIVPVFMHGLGKSLPKGEGLLVPFFCDVFVGEVIRWAGDRKEFMVNLKASFEALSTEEKFSEWE